MCRPPDWPTNARLVRSERVETAVISTTVPLGSFYDIQRLIDVFGLEFLLGVAAFIVASIKVLRPYGLLSIHQHKCCKPVHRSL